MSRLQEKVSAENGHKGGNKPVVICEETESGNRERGSAGTELKKG